MCTFPLDISFWHAFRVPYVFPSGTRAFLPPVSPGPSDRECSMNGRVYNSAIIQSVTISFPSINHSFYPSKLNKYIHIHWSIQSMFIWKKKRKEKEKSFVIIICVIVSQSHDRSPRTDGIINRRIEKGSGLISVTCSKFLSFLWCLLACCSSVDQQVARRIYVESVLHSVQSWLIEAGCWVGQKLVSHKVRSDSIRNYSVGQSDGHPPPFRVRVTYSVGS